METYNFTLIVEGPDLQTDQAQDALFAAGCDDALVGKADGIQYLEFDREADSYGMALTKAMQDVRSAVDGIKVIHVEPDDLVTMSEIAQRLGRSRESVRLLISGDRGPGEFPVPVTHLRSRTRLWRWPEVLHWFSTRHEHEFGEALVHLQQNANVTAFLNALLSYKRYREAIPDADRTVLEEVVG